MSAGGICQMENDFWRRGLINRPMQAGKFHSSSALRGIKVNRSVTAAFRIYGDDGGAVIWGSGSVPDIKVALSRYLITKDNTGGHIRAHALMGQLKSYNGEWNTEQAAGVYGYLELVRSTGTIAFGGYGKTAAVIGCIENSGAMTVDTNHKMAGVLSLSKLTSDIVRTGKVAAFMSDVYDTTNWSDGTARILWPYGLYLAGCVRGISFDGVVPPADAGNYGQTLDCTWLGIDPGSGGSFGAKLMFSNIDTSGYTLYGLGLRSRSAAAGAISVGLNVSASAAVAASGQLFGGQFYLQNSGSYTIVGVYQSAALYCKSWLAAACGPSASALWIDDESSVKATAQYMVDITMNGSIEIDKVFHIYGGDPGADTFIDFDTCDQGTGAFVVATASGGATRSHRIKCTVNGTTVGYMSLYTD